VRYNKKRGRSWFLGHFSIIWTILEDCHSSKLEGFGEVSPQLSQSLDPQIDRLITLVNSVSKLVTKG
jgi:hypothetical protein